jgi:hypothetical protein
MEKRQKYIVFALILCGVLWAIFFYLLALIINWS